MSQNWRPEDNAFDYLAHRQKAQNVDERRPVIRRASDLVGPGIAQSAVRVTNYNDPLALFDGYYSSAPGAQYAPNAEDSFVGFVVSDAELGGVQSLRSLATGVSYERSFRRSPADPSTLFWTDWRPGVDGQPLMILARTNNLDLASGWSRPQMGIQGQRGDARIIGTPGTPGITGGGILISTPGFYSVSANVTLTGGTDGNRRLVMIEKVAESAIDAGYGTGVIVAREENAPSQYSNLGYFMASLAGEVYVAAGEALRLVIFHNASSTVTMGLSTFSAKRG